MEKPLGWFWRSPWWNLDNGNELIAIFMIFAFLGTLYFLWHGLNAISANAKVMSYFSSILCFGLLVTLGFIDTIKLYI